jgi:LmbE family N-acetylglucosaminyl deacetylase
VSGLLLATPEGRPLQVLCLGAHADDIEIGCGGTLLRLIEEVGDVCCDWVVFSSNPIREREARRSAEAFLQGARTRNVVVEAFRDGYFPAEFAQIKDRFETFKKFARPDVVFTHYRDDRHQDHRVVSDVTWNTFRGHLILEYEIPKYDGDFGQPNAMVPLRREHVDRKIELLFDHFPSQTEKGWFTSETLRGAMRLRGIETPGEDAFAEAFYDRKMKFRFEP